MKKFYVDQHKGFIVSGFEDKVYKLRKTLYGLNKLVELSMKRSTITCLNMVLKEVSEAILYIKTKEGGESPIVSIYIC